MPKQSRFTDAQIIRAIQEVEGGSRTADVCRRLGISEQTFYLWKGKFGGMDVPDAKRLKGLEDENRRLKQMVADLSLDNQALKLVLSKKW